MRPPLWRLLFVAVALVAIPVFVVGGCLWWNLGRPLPTDDVLRRRFEAHRADLDRLAALALADTLLVGAGHDWMLRRFSIFVRDTPQLHRLITDEEARATGRHHYRSRLDRTGFRAISRSPDGNTVWLTARSNLMANKGLVFSRVPLTPVRTSLDGLERRDHPGSGYRPLAPGWFMYLRPRE